MGRAGAALQPYKARGRESSSGFSLPWRLPQVRGGQTCCSVPGRSFEPACSAPVRGPLSHLYSPPLCMGWGGGLSLPNHGTGCARSAGGIPALECPDPGQIQPEPPGVFILQVPLPTSLTHTCSPKPRAPQTQSRSLQVMSCPLFWCAQPIGLAAWILPEPAWALPRTSSRSPRSRP